MLPREVPGKDARRDSAGTLHSVPVFPSYPAPGGGLQFGRRFTRMFQQRFGPVGFCAMVLALGASLLGVAAATAQTTPEQQADLLLNSARKAYNEKNFPFARDRFREFVGKYGGHKQLAQARYGLALALLECPEKDYNAAAEQLQMV